MSVVTVCSGAVERALDDELTATTGRREQHQVVLQVVGSIVAIAGVVGRDAIRVEVDP